MQGPIEKKQKNDVVAGDNDTEMDEVTSSAMLQDRLVSTARCLFS